MTDDRWVLAKIAAVQLRFPELPNKAAVSKALAAEAYLAKCQCQTATGKKTKKRDVSDEPRVPAGQTGGGQWTTDGGPSASLTNSLLVPAQAIAPPMPIPVPFELPTLPIRPYPPLPLDIPGVTREPVNPYPDRPECVEEWEHAIKFCNDLKARGKLGSDGYRGFGGNVVSCILGMVSEACGGNPIA
jgi:hypothetical protein